MVEEPENDAEHQAQQECACERHVEPEAAALDHDVTGQTAQPDPREQRPECPEHDEDESKDYQEAGHGQDLGQDLMGPPDLV